MLKFVVDWLETRGVSEKWALILADAGAVILILVLIGGGLLVFGFKDERVRSIIKPVVRKRD